MEMVLDMEVNEEVNWEVERRCDEQLLSRVWLVGW